MNNKIEIITKIFQSLKKDGLSSDQEETIIKEIEWNRKHEAFMKRGGDLPTIFSYKEFYDYRDISHISLKPEPNKNYLCQLKTLDELLEQDKQRENDGFPKRIRLGKLIKPSTGNKAKVVVVPTTTEPKFYHDNSITEDGEGEGQTGGSGNGEEGEVIGEQPAQPQGEGGEGQGAGQGEGGEHDVGSEAFDLGRVLTEKFELPNLKQKGTKRSFSRYVYDLTDKNKGFGQLLDKKATLKKIIQTNVQLGRISPHEYIKGEDLLIIPTDHIFRIMSREKDFESQAMVFFVRDYSGSMEGKPTEVISTQHLFIYSWLMYQYKNSVKTRFILHDNEAKEVPDFYSYYRSQVAGGTNVYPAFELVNKIVEEEMLAKDYNIYVFHGTDGDDWESNGTKMLNALRKMLVYTNRVGITVAKNSWSGGRKTTVENYLEKSGLLKEKPSLFRLDSFDSAQAGEDRIIESIKKLVD